MSAWPVCLLLVFVCVCVCLWPCSCLSHCLLACLLCPPVYRPGLLFQIINLISAAQENCSIGVAQILERVLEILRSTELYSPYFSPQVKDDQMTHDLVGGLMTVS